MSMTLRTPLAAALAGLVAAGASHDALAQQAGGPSSQAVAPSGWTFSIAPYLWLPHVNTELNFKLPPQLGGTAVTDVTAGPGDYLSKLHFAAMFAAEARYDRFSLLSDFIYTSVGDIASDIKEVDFFGLPTHPIPHAFDLGTNTTLQATVWTLAGGYTVVREDWGNIDLIAGFRFLNVKASTDFDLALTLTSPSGNGATFGGVGNLSGGQNIWNGIGGLHGRIRLGNAGLFIPYYFDIGAGGSRLTWQIASGLGYQTGWAGVSLTYRYLSFQQGSSDLVRHINLGGPMLAVNFDF
jgi:hypothetical protein